MGPRHPPLTASSVLTLAVGRRRPPVVALSSSTLAASATVVAVVGRRGPPLVTSSSSTPAASATVVGRRRLPFVALSSSTGLCYGHRSGRTTTPDARALVDVIVVDGFGLTNALDGPGRLRAVDGRLSAPRLLARGAVRGLLPRSTARNLRLAHPDDPS